MGGATNLERHVMNIEYGKQARPQRVVIYGQHGVGKSTLIAGLEKPLILDTEDGTAHLDVARVRIGNLGMLRDVYVELREELKAGTCPFRTIALDTADRLWDMCAEAILLEQRKRSMEDLGYNKAYTLATERFKEVFKSFDVLCRLGAHVVISCHANVERMNPPDAPEYTAYTLKVAPPNKQAQAAAAFLTEWADAILFARMEHTIDAKAHKAVMGGGGPRRVLETQPSAAWTAKVRCAGMDGQLPLEAAAIMPLFDGGTAANTSANMGGTPAQSDMGNSMQQSMQGGDSYGANAAANMNANVEGGQA